jgi:molecular chaperone DnaK
LQELGDKVSGGDRAAAESALSDLKTAIKGDDKDQIERKAEALAKASQGLVAQAQQAAGAGAAGAAPGAEAGGAGGAAGNAGKSDDVVDAEFEEVRDKDRKA